MNAYYSVLDLPEDATLDQIKMQFRRLARAFHPDRFTNKDDKEYAELKMRDLNVAYTEVLKQAKVKRQLKGIRSRMGRGSSIWQLHRGFSLKGFNFNRQSAHRQSAHRQSAHRQSAHRQSAHRQSTHRQGTYPGNGAKVNNATANNAKVTDDPQIAQKRLLTTTLLLGVMVIDLFVLLSLVMTWA